MSEFRNFLVGNDEFYGERRPKFRRLYDDVVVFDTKECFGEIISSRSVKGSYRSGENFFDAAGLSDAALEFLYKGIHSAQSDNAYFLVKGSAGAILVSGALHKSCGLGVATVVRADAKSVVRVLCSGLIKGIEVKLDPSAKNGVGRMQACDEDTYRILDEIVFYLRACFALRDTADVSYMEIYRCSKVFASFVGCILDASDTSVFDASGTGYDPRVLGGMLLLTSIFIRRMTDLKEMRLSLSADGDGGTLTTLSALVSEAYGKADLNACSEIRKCKEIASHLGARYELCEEDGRIRVRLSAMPQGVISECELKSGSELESKAQMLDDMIFMFETE
jgi:hypothetical protein